MIITLPWRRMTLQRSQRRFTDVEIFTVVARVPT
jgi:hypothetical protein